MGRHRLRVVEAFLLLVLARLLVAGVPFRYWRESLGQPIAGHSADAESDGPPPVLALACAHSVQRAGYRLPGSLCLPRAMALQWMLRRRSIASTLLLGVLPEQERGGLNDLHAWVEVARIVILEEGEGSHRTILRLRAGGTRNCCDKV